MAAGILSVVSLAKETTWGTPVTPSKSLSVSPTGGMSIKKNLKLLTALRGTLAKNYDSVLGKVAYDGAYTMDAFADYLGYFLLSALGTDTPALHSGETVVYDHVFSESATKPSYTIEEAIADNCRRYAGSIVTDIKLTGKVGETVQAVATVSGKSQASSTAITPAFTSVPAFNHTQAVVKIGGVALGEVEDFEIEYKNNLEMVYALGNAEPSYYAVKGSEVSGKLTLYLDSTSIAQLTAYINKTRQSIEIILTGTAIGTAATYSLDITVPKTDFKTAHTKITDAHDMLEIEFEGIYDSTTSKLIGVTLTNLITAY